MKTFLALLVSGVLLGASAASQAQFAADSDLSKNWELRAGIFVPEKKASRSKGGDVWLTLGAERAFYETETWKATISVDFYGAHKKNLYSVPFSFNFRGSATGVRYGVGAGLSLGHDLDRGIASLAYNALIGYQFATGGNPVNVDLRYLGTVASRQELNGWALSVGYQF